MAAVDHPDAVAAIAAERRRRLTLLVDIDPGIHRTGVADAGGRRGARAGDRRRARR